MKLLNRGITPIFIGIAGFLITLFIFYLWVMFFPDLDKLCNKKSVILIEGMTSCSGYSKVKDSLNLKGYKYLEDRSSLLEGVFIPKFFTTSFIVEKYYFKSCFGRASFRFVNGYLSSIIFFPLNGCDINTENNSNKVDGSLKTRRGRNFKGVEYYFWGDERLEGFYRNWLKIFS